ncbi:MAG: hypothetical protein ACKV2O_00535 [Acidimicrobiales bacterium]
MTTSLNVGDREYFSGAAILREIGERLRVLLVAGILTGVVVGGVGGRAAMFILRLTSPDSVRGVTSDDGFTIGEVTLGGTYSLLVLGAFIGLIGAAAYRWVSPWLLGPRWFRRVTVAAASSAVVGSMLVHADGVDFTLLQPTWLAVSLFVALPGLFGWLIGWAVDAVAAPGSWTSTGKRRWVLPVVCVAAFPPVIVAVVAAAAAVALWVMVGRVGAPNRPVQPLPLPLPLSLSWAVRGLWLTVALAGLVALVRDVEALM